MPLFIFSGLANLLKVFGHSVNFYSAAVFKIPLHKL